MIKNNEKLCYLRPLPTDNFPFVEGSFDSLTEYGYIQKIIKRLNNLIDIVNSHQEFIDNYESEIENLQNQINSINNYLSNLDSRINARLDSIEEELNNKFNALTRDVLELITTNYNILKQYVDDRDAYLENKIDNISIDSIKLYDPTTGLLSNIQVVINNVFNSLNVDAITAGEFDALELTASEFDAYEITAYDFDTKAKQILI